MASRKRTPAPESTETSTTVAELPEAETPAATAELPASETNGKATSFADRVGQKKWSFTPDPFGIAADYLAGVHLFESKRDRQVAIRFGEGRLEDKPSQAVIDTMKEAGYRWNPTDRIWAHPVLPESALGTRIEAERLYQTVRKMIRAEKGIEDGPETSR
jgi:hypothetical protein